MADRYEFQNFQQLDNTPANIPVVLDPVSDVYRPLDVRDGSVSQQPDGDYVYPKADGQATYTNTPLLAHGVYTSDWIDTDGWKTIEIYITSNVPSSQSGIEVQFTDDAQATTPTVVATSYFRFSEVDINRGYLHMHVDTLLDGFRIKYQNNSENQANFELITTLRNESVRGMLNDGNVMVIADFQREVALGNISNFETSAKFGMNPSINTASAPEDAWNGGGLYTGFNAVANENLETFSSSTADVGALRSSGTITSSSRTQVIDSSATFISDGVQVGDVFLNDTQFVHGIVTSVDSETTLTVFKLQKTDSNQGQYTNVTGSSYRIAYAAGTGAAVVEWLSILNADLEEQPDVFVILNGQTPVITTGDFYRLSKGSVILAGSGGENAGSLTCRQQTTTANVFAVMPATFNRTLIAAGTVPKGKLFLIEKLKVGLLVGNGTSGSGIVAFKTRLFGCVFNTRRIYTATTGADKDDELAGGILVDEGTDYKFNVVSVTDNGSQVTASIEYLEIYKNTTN